MHPALALSPSSNNFARNRAIAGRELAKRACLYIGHLWEVECVAISEERGGSAIYLWVCRTGQDRTGQVLITGEDRDGWTEPGTLA